MTNSKTKKMKKKRVGSSVRHGALTLVVFLSFACTLALLAGPDPQKKAPPAKVQDTLILVSTFAETGQTLRGARVRLYPGDADGKVAKGKHLEGRTNHVGEFPFHVPKTEANYVLVAEMNGFARTEKSVKVHGEDQLDVFLQLPAKP